MEEINNFNRVLLRDVRSNIFNKDNGDIVKDLIVKDGKNYYSVEKGKEHLISNLSSFVGKGIEILDKKAAKAAEKAGRAYISPFAAKEIPTLVTGSAQLGDA